MSKRKLFWMGRDREPLPSSSPDPARMELMEATGHALADPPRRARYV